MKITGMPETTINLSEDGELSIWQKGHDGSEDQLVCFPVEIAVKVASEILRLAKGNSEV